MKEIIEVFVIGVVVVGLIYFGITGTIGMSQEIAKEQIYKTVKAECLR